MAFIGVVLLLVIVGVVPWWIQREQQKKCYINLKLIDGAVQQWALEYKKFSSDTYSLRDPGVLMWMRGSVLPICPSRGTYTRAPSVGDTPKCNIPGHTL